MMMMVVVRGVMVCMMVTRVGFFERRDFDEANGEVGREQFGKEMNPNGGRDLGREGRLEGGMGGGEMKFLPGDKLKVISKQFCLFLKILQAS